MKATPNKICLTQKGLQFINQEKQQLTQQNSIQNPLSVHPTQVISRISSLPLLKSRSLIAQPKLFKQLSIISRTKLKLQKIGLKSMSEKQADQLVRRKLNEQFEGSSNYVKSIIPQLVKMTKERHQNNELQSRFERARMYIARLEHSQKTKFVFRPRKNHQMTV